MNGKKFIEIDGDLIKRSSIIEVSKICTSDYTNGLFLRTEVVYFFIRYKGGRYTRIESESYRINYWTVEPKSAQSCEIKMDCDIAREKLEQKRNYIIKLISYNEQTI
jgi:hypothetical protein